MSQKKIKIPKKNAQKPTVAKRPQPQTEVAQEVQELSPSDRLELQKAQKQMAATLENMTDRQKECIGIYLELSQNAARVFAKAKYGPSAPMEQGFEVYEALIQQMTELPIQASKGEFAVDGLFAMLGAAAGYQAGIALQKQNKPLEEDMVEGAMKIFEGGFRLMVQTAQEAYKGKVLRAMTYRGQ